MVSSKWLSTSSQKDIEIDAVIDAVVRYAREAETRDAGLAPRADGTGGKGPLGTPLGVTVELSKPRPVNSRARALLAAGTLIGVFATIALAGAASVRNSGSTGFYAGVGVAALVLLLATLVLAMGCGRVKVRAKAGSKDTADA